jgi:carbon monoxide dehydrogenase subunit G
MNVTGEYRLAPDRQVVWQALVDPDILRRCIPGCESLEQLDAETYRARVKMVIGPVKAAFNTELKVSNANPPESYRLEGEGRSGAVGFGRGQADITLREEEGATLLKYSANFQVGGRLAQLGSRLLVGASRKLADDFFDRLAADIDATAERVPSPGAGRRSTRYLWAAVAALAALAGMVWLLLRLIASG